MKLIKEILAPAPPKPDDMDLARHLERWQCQHPIVRIWRLRWYMLAPFRFAWYLLGYLVSLLRRNDEEENVDIALLWRFATSHYSMKMDHFYSMSEVFGRARERIHAKRK